MSTYTTSDHERSAIIRSYHREPSNQGKSKRQIARELGEPESFVRRSLNSRPESEKANMAKPPTVEDVRLDALILDPDLQPRVATDDHAVADYSKSYKRGRNLGLISVFRDPEDRSLRVASGFHRVKAAILAGLTTLKAEVRIGGRSDCLRHAVGANLQHVALRYTSADKRRAVMLVLADPTLARKTDVELAEICGVSDRTVGNRRRELQVENFDVAGSTERVDRNGRTLAVKGQSSGGTDVIAHAGQAAPMAPHVATVADPGTPASDEIQVGAAAIRTDVPDEDEALTEFNAEAFAGARCKKFTPASEDGKSSSEDVSCGISAPESEDGQVAVVSKPHDLAPRVQTDDEWLESIEVRAKLSPRCRAIFDQDALAHRAITASDAFKPFANVVQRHAKATAGVQVGRYVGALTFALKVMSPAHWLFCGACGGEGFKTDSECSTCRGKGYQIKTG